MIGVLAATQAPELFAELVLVGPSPRYIDDGDYVGGFSEAQIHELLEFLDSNHMGWSHAMAPAIMGNADRPELAEELTNSFCRTDPEIAKRFARTTFLSDNRADLDGVRARTPDPAVLRGRDRAARRRRIRARAAAGQRAGHPGGHGPLPEPERARGDRSPPSAPSSEAISLDARPRRGGPGRRGPRRSLRERALRLHLRRHRRADHQGQPDLVAWLGYERGAARRAALPDLLNIAGKIYYETHFAPLLRMQGFFHEVALDLVRADGPAAGAGQRGRAA